MRLPVAVAAACCWLGPAAALAQPAASLSSWTTSNGTGVRFVQLTPDVVDNPTMDLPDETSDGAYKYAIDTQALSWNPDCTCYRYYVVFARARGTGVLTRHKFKAIPSGSFADQRVPVRLSITDADGAHTDDIALPVASAPGLEPSPLVEVKTEKALVPVSLGGATDIQLTVRNPNAHESVQIGPDILVTPQSPTVWKSPPAVTGAQLPLTLPPGNTRTLTMRLEPVVKQAIGLSFPPTSADLPHTAVRIDVPYSSRTFSGRDARVALDVPLRFRPSMTALGLWLLGGVILGSLIPVVALASKGKATVRTWGTAVGAAIVAGLILEVFGIVLAQNKSKLMLFGFDIDPWQTTPVMLLGILTGLMGLQSAKLIEEKLTKKKSDA